MDLGNLREKQSRHMKNEQTLGTRSRIVHWVSGISMSQLVLHNLSYQLAKIPRWRMNFFANWLVLQRGLINLKRLG